VLDRVEVEAEDPAAALLSVTVVDPTCGSGHFLLAAARQIATRVARHRAEGVALLGVLMVCLSPTRSSLANQIIGQAEQLARQRTDLDVLNRLLPGLPAGGGRFESSVPLSRTLTTF